MGHFYRFRYLRVAHLHVAAVHLIYDKHLCGRELQAKQLDAQYGLERDDADRVFDHGNRAVGGYTLSLVGELKTRFQRIDRLEVGLRFDGALLNRFLLDHLFLGLIALGFCQSFLVVATHQHERKNGEGSYQILVFHTILVSFVGF